MRNEEWARVERGFSKKKKERKNATFRYNGKQFLPSKPRLHMHTKPRFERPTMRGGAGAIDSRKIKAAKTAYDAGTGYHTLTSIETSYGTAAAHLCSRLEDRINSPSLPPSPSRAYTTSTYWIFVPCTLFPGYANGRWQFARPNRVAHLTGRIYLPFPSAKPMIG